MTWGASRNIRTQTGSASNREGSGISFGEVNLSKKIEAGSISIASAFWNMLSATLVTIDICRQGSKSGDVSLMKIELKEVIISLYEIISTGTVPIERVVLNYTQFKEIGLTAPPDNTAGTNAVTGYDLKINEPL